MPREGGWRGGPTIPWSSPPPPPPVHPRLQYAPGATGFLEWTGGGGGRYRGPTPTQPPNLTLRTPITPPSPPEPPPELWASDLSPQGWLDSGTGSGFGWGRGLGGFSRPLTQPSPPPPQVRPPPSDVRVVGRRGPGEEGDMVGLMDDYKLSRPEASASGSAVYTPPPRPPPHSPILLHPISRHPCQRTSGNRVKEDGGGGRVWVPSIALGRDRGGFLPPRLYIRTWELLRTEALEGEETLFLKWVPNLRWWWWIDGDAKPTEAPSPPKNVTGACSAKIPFSWNNGFQATRFSVD